MTIDSLISANIGVIRAAQFLARGVLEPGLKLGLCAGLQRAREYDASIGRGDRLRIVEFTDLQPRPCDRQRFSFRGRSEIHRHSVGSEFLLQARANVVAHDRVGVDGVSVRDRIDEQGMIAGRVFHLGGGVPIRL